MLSRGSCGPCIYRSGSGLMKTMAMNIISSSKENRDYSAEGCSASGKKYRGLNCR